MIGLRTLLCANGTAVIVSFVYAMEPLRLTIVETPLTPKPLVRPATGRFEFSVNNDGTKIAYIKSDGEDNCLRDRIGVPVPEEFEKFRGEVRQPANAFPAGMQAATIGL
jgi:hypothetical protein